MARIECEISTGEEENENGHSVECTYAECTLCEHVTMSFGTSERSVRRCLILMRDECPQGEANFYVEER